MRNVSPTIPALLGLLLGVVALATPTASAPATAQETLAIGIDAHSQGNDSVALGAIDTCLSVPAEQEFTLDLYIREVSELLAWEVYVEFDPAVIEVVGRDVEMFLAGNPGSAVLDVSGRLPNRDGLYRAAAADTSDPPTPDSGSGVLARFTLKAVGPGTSDITLIKRDIDGDGAVDQGPLLRDVDGNALGDATSDAIFDGPIHDAVVVVDAPCDDEQSNGSPLSADGSGGGGVSPAVIAAAAAGGAVALVAGAFLAFRLFRRAGPTSA